MTPEATVTRFSARETTLIGELARGARHDDAAKTAGCSRSTIARALRRREFVQAVDAARMQLFDAVLGGAIDKGQAALAVLDEVMRDPNPPERSAARVAAAGKLLDLAVRFREIHELSERIARIEEAVRFAVPGLR